MSALPFEQLKALIELRDGKLYWLPRPGLASAYAGKPVHLAKTNHGYLSFGVTVSGQRFYLTEHRCIWALTHGAWPKQCIDHINGDPADNRIENLRDVSLALNQRNRRINKNNTSGVAGVCFTKSRRKWCARISAGGQVIVLGEFDAFEDAVFARRAAEAEHGYIISTEDLAA